MVLGNSFKCGEFEIGGTGESRLIGGEWRVNVRMMNGLPHRSIPILEYL
jgi:hypothetical protein